jgi:hypothetical protein
MSFDGSIKESIFYAVHYVLITEKNRVQQCQVLSHTYVHMCSYLSKKYRQPSISFQS